MQRVSEVTDKADRLLAEQALGDAGWRRVVYQITELSVVRFSITYPLPCFLLAVSESSATAYGACVETVATNRFVKRILLSSEIALGSRK